MKGSHLLVRHARRGVDQDGRLAQRTKAERVVDADLLVHELARVELSHLGRRAGGRQGRRQGEREGKREGHVLHWDGDAAATIAVVVVVGVVLLGVVICVGASGGGAALGAGGGGKVVC